VYYNCKVVAITSDFSSKIWEDFWVFPPPATRLEVQFNPVADVKELPMCSDREYHYIKPNSRVKGQARYQRVTLDGLPSDLDESRLILTFAGSPTPQRGARIPPNPSASRPAP